MLATRGAWRTPVPLGKRDGKDLKRIRRETARERLKLTDAHKYGYPYTKGHAFVFEVLFVPAVQPNDIQYYAISFCHFRVDLVKYLVLPEKCENAQIESSFFPRK